MLRFIRNGINFSQHLEKRAILRLASFFFAFAIFPILINENVLPHSDNIDPEIAEVTEQLVDDPNNVNLLLKRGVFYRFQGKFTEALRDLEQAWLLDQNNRKVALERCRTLVALGRESMAELALTDYLEGESGVSRVVALTERAHLYARTGQVDLALRDYAEALNFYPTVELYLARGHLQEVQGRLAGAVAGYREGLSRLPQARVLRKELIRVATAHGLYSEALSNIDTELASSSVKTEWYLRKAEVLSAMGKADALEQARNNALAEANRMLSKRATALNQVARAKVYQAMGQLEMAKQDLRLALQKSPRFTEARDLLMRLESQ